MMCPHGYPLNDPNAEPCYREGCYDIPSPGAAQMRISSISHNGAVTRTFFQTKQPRRTGKRYFLLERHEGPCECSFCDKSGRQLKTLRSFGAKLDGIGWNMIWWPTPWTRWYLRWVK